MSFIFGGNTGLTYEQAQQKRKIAEMLTQGMSRAPQNVGEGLNAIGQALAIRGMNKQADKADTAGRSKADSVFSALLGGSAIPKSTPQSGSGSGGATNYRDAIASIESAGSGDYSAVGPNHPKLGRALGRYQVMEANIPQWSQAALGRSVSPDEFLANPEVQDAIFDHQFNGYVEKFGPEGAAQAWFAGPGGVGKMDRKDSLGTSVGDYTQKFSNALGGGQRPVQVADNGLGIEQIMAAMSNPYMRPEQKQALQIMLEQKMQAGDPMRQMQMERGQLELEAMRNPQPKQTDDMREYEYAKQQGYQGSFQDFMLMMRGASATQISNVVNTGDTPDMRPLADKPDKGFQRRWDAERQTYVDEPIPGSDPSVDRQDLAEKAVERERQQKIKMGTTLTNLQMNIDEISDGGMPVTGPYGAIAGRIPGTPQADWRTRNQQITTSAALAEVQNMRDNSPTGGAVGQLTDSEREAIAVAASGLNNSQSAQEYIRAAENYRKVMLDTAFGQGSWSIDPKTGDVNLMFGGDPASQSAGGDDFLNVDIMSLTPEQLDTLYEQRFGGSR
jgi:hypothetical protein